MKKLSTAEKRTEEQDGKEIGDQGDREEKDMAGGEREKRSGRGSKMMEGFRSGCWECEGSQGDR